MKMEQEDSYFKILDDQGYVLAYFQPDYGNIHPKDKEDEVIKKMLEDKENINRGLLYLPMLKLNILEREYDIEEIRYLLDLAIKKVERWIKVLRSLDENSSVRVVKSHTDPDMLALLIELEFKTPIRLNSEEDE